MDIHTFGEKSRNNPVATYLHAVLLRVYATAPPVKYISGGLVGVFTLTITSDRKRDCNIRTELSITEYSRYLFSCMLLQHSERVGR